MIPKIMFRKNVDGKGATIYSSATDDMGEMIHKIFSWDDLTGLNFGLTLVSLNMKKWWNGELGRDFCFFVERHNPNIINRSVQERRSGSDRRS